MVESPEFLVECDGKVSRVRTDTLSIRGEGGLEAGPRDGTSDGSA